MVAVRVVLDAAAVRAAEVGGGEARGPGPARRPDRRGLDGDAVAADAGRGRVAHGDKPFTRPEQVAGDRARAERRPRPAARVPGVSVTRRRSPRTWKVDGHRRPAPARSRDRRRPAAGGEPHERARRRRRRRAHGSPRPRSTGCGSGPASSSPDGSDRGRSARSPGGRAVLAASADDTDVGRVALVVARRRASAVARGRPARASARRGPAGAGRAARYAPARDRTHRQRDRGPGACDRTGHRGRGRRRRGRDHHDRRPRCEAMAEAELFWAMVPEGAGRLEVDVVHRARRLRGARLRRRLDRLVGDGEHHVVVLRRDLHGRGCGAARCSPTATKGIHAGMLGPVGTARRVDGGYRVSGRYQFGSGCAHALVHRCRAPSRSTTTAPRSRPRAACPRCAWC